MSRKRPKEKAEQKTLAEFLDLRGAVWFHPPNENVLFSQLPGGKVANILSKQRKMGLKSGVPDCLIFESPPNQPDPIESLEDLKSEIQEMENEQEINLLGKIEEIKSEIEEQKHGTAIELKRTPKNENRQGPQPSEEQIEWLSKLESVGFDTSVCHGAKEAMRKLQNLGY